MDCEKSESAVLQAFETDEIYDILDEYIIGCNACKDGDPQLQDPKENSKRSKGQGTQKPLFPNIAGFCRQLGVGTGELERLSRQYPKKYEKILTVLEDEALNSGVSASLVTAYLKKHLGYDKNERTSTSESNMQILFEHDIFGDGE